jgi:hypothetical protein
MVDAATNMVDAATNMVDASLASVYVIIYSEQPGKDAFGARPVAVGIVGNRFEQRVMASCRFSAFFYFARLRRILAVTGYG